MTSATGFILQRIHPPPQNRSPRSVTASVLATADEWKNALRHPLDFARQSLRSALRPAGARWKGQGRDRRVLFRGRDKISRILCFLHLAQGLDRDQPRIS